MRPEGLIAQTLLQLSRLMITTLIKRPGAPCCHLKWFAPAWSRFLDINSSPVFGPGSPRVYLDAWLALAVSRKTGGSTSRIRANAWTGASQSAAVFAGARLARTAKARPERYSRAEVQVAGYPSPDAAAEDGSRPTAWS